MSNISRALSKWRTIKDETIAGKNTAKRVGEAGIESTEALRVAEHRLEEQIKSVASGSPKGVYSTVTALRNAHPNGNAFMYVVSSTGHWHYWNGTIWEDGGLYQTALEGAVSADIGTKTYTNLP